MFKITNGKGFHITFSNGNTISTQFGAGNYCDHYNKMNFTSKNYEKYTSELAEEGSMTAEIWCWNKEGNPLMENPIGYNNPEEFLEIINKYGKEDYYDKPGVQ